MAYSFSIHSNVIGEESTFQYPDPDPEKRPISITSAAAGDEVSLNSGSSAVSESFEARNFVCI